jgi:hypothetical protein
VLLHQIAGDGEEIGLDVADRARIPGLQQTQIDFLS